MHRYIAFYWKKQQKKQLYLSGNFTEIIETQICDRNWIFIFKIIHFLFKNVSFVKFGTSNRNYNYHHHQLDTNSSILYIYEFTNYPVMARAKRGPSAKLLRFFYSVENLPLVVIVLHFLLATLWKFSPLTSCKINKKNYLNFKNDFLIIE